MKKTKVSALAGRVIESVTIVGTDNDESDNDFRGPSLEIRVSGGYVFVFTATSQPTATSELGKLDSKGDLHCIEPRKFK